MDTNTLAPKVAAATLASAHAAGVGMARVAQFIPGQTDICECVPFLINRENVI